MPRSLTLPNEFRIAVARMSRRIRTSVADETISFPHLAAMATLAKFQPLTLQELSAKERVTPPSMLRTVNALVEHGYIERTPHETDGRKLMLGVTASGEAMLEATRRQRNLWLADRIEELSDDDRATLKRAVDIMLTMAEA